MIRHKDISGVSGTGVVAEGVVFSDGTTVLRWLVAIHPSTNIYDDISDLERIHGHDGATELRFTS
jgi:hypothetical protein